MSENKANILVVDDDEKLRLLMQQLLEKEEYTVFLASKGSELFPILEQKKINLIILDLMLPERDGFSLCQQIREMAYTTPIIMLTAVNEYEKRVHGFAVGADDYLAKPFYPEELLARITAILRRSDTNAIQKNYTQLVFAGWTLDKVQRCLYSPEKVNVSLTAGEFRLLEILAEHAPQVVHRDTLLSILENRIPGPFDRSIDVRVSRLRQKLEDDPKNPLLIKTIRAGGYLLSAEVQRID